MRLETPALADAAAAFAAGGFVQEFFVTPDGNISTGVRIAAEIAANEHE